MLKKVKACRHGFPLCLIAMIVFVDIIYSRYYSFMVRYVLTGNRIKNNHSLCLFGGSKCRTLLLFF